MNNETLSGSAQRVQDALNDSGVDLRVRELDNSTRTAQDAAHSIGCEVGQIAKSLIFRGANSDKPLLFVVSGSNQLNTGNVEMLVGEKLVKADADFVRASTGYAIGGVPPLGHVKPVETYIDEDLLQFDEVWAAAGTPKSVFALKPHQLVQITGGRVICVV